jgi:hypothetical protein
MGFYFLLLGYLVVARKIHTSDTHETAINSKT